MLQEFDLNISFLGVDLQQQQQQQQKTNKQTPGF
jgi:hypothetical protein